MPSKLRTYIFQTSIKQTYILWMINLQNIENYRNLYTYYYELRDSINNRLKTDPTNNNQ